MLSLPAAVRIYFFTEAVDMRNGFDGLAAMVKASGLDAFTGHLFVFVSRRCNRVKVLSWERGGYVLWYKRLERGKFKRPIMESETTQVQLDPDQLTLLLEGIDLRGVRRPKRWSPQKIDRRGKV